MKFYLINNVSGNSSCFFNVYYDSINVSNLASIYGPTTPYSPASNLTFSQISSGNLVVVLPDTAGSIIISDNCGCPPVATLFPSPTPTNTPTTTPTKTKTATPTPTRTLTPTITNTKTPTPTITKTPAGIDCNDCYYYNVTISQDDLNNAINNQGSTAQFNNKVCLFNFRTCNVPSLNVNYVYDTAGTYQILGLGTQNIASIFYYNNAQPVVGQSFFTRTVKYCTPTPTPTLTQTPTRTPTVTPTRNRPLPPIGRPFISVWRTTVTNEMIVLPYDPNGFYDGTIQWGDGTSSINSFNNRTHIYAIPGTYTITIIGRVVGWTFYFQAVSPGLLPQSDRNILQITQWGDSFEFSNAGFQFTGCYNLTFTATDTVNVNYLTNMEGMFNECTSMITLYGMENWNVSNTTNMAVMFKACFNFNTNLNSWNVSNVTDMRGMFSSAFIYNQPMNNWNVSSVTDMNEMFADTRAFNQNIGNWNVSNVTTMGSMFDFARAFNQPLSGWNVSNVTSMIGMFRGSIFNQPINSWNVSKVENFDQMFSYNVNFNQSLNNWGSRLINAKTMGDMFNGATSFNQNIGGWNVSGVTSFVNFMTGKSSANYSTANYDALLNGWSNRNLQFGRTINFGSIQYTSTGLTGRNRLIFDFGWTIFDGGQR